MDQILGQIDRTVDIVDDVVVYATDDKKYDKVLHNLLRVAKENSLVLNPSECKIKTDSLTFFGMKYEAVEWIPTQTK